MKHPAKHLLSNKANPAPISQQKSAKLRSRGLTRIAYSVGGITSPTNPV
jgi:hypothetical protein